VRQIFPAAGRVDLGSLDGPVTPATGAPDDLIAAIGDIYAYPARTCIRANMIASVDGAITVDGRSGGLSGPADRLVFGVLRSLADVIVVGAETARVERYRQAQPDELWQQLRVGRPPAPPLAVLTRRLDVDLTGRLFRGGPARTIVFTTDLAPHDRLKAAARVADVVISGAAGVVPSALINVLEERGYRRILVEGGPTVLGEFTAAGLLDELCLTISPLLEGGYSAARITSAPATSTLTGLRLASVLEDDGFLLTCYLRALAPGRRRSSASARIAAPSLAERRSFT
jgi:riboflavin biosynthesis pyrimidine reductase